MKATGRRIKALREGRSITVRSLAKELGLSDVQAIYKWQRGDALPSTDNLLALSLFFDVSIEEILSFTLS